MKLYPGTRFTTRCRLFALVLAAGLALPLPSFAAAVALANAPLASSPTSAVQPNLLFVLDDSGSMTFTYLPDAADNFRTDYGYHSNQCNALYYNPAITYLPPVDSAGAAYASATFTAALDNGYDTASTARNLNSGFIANRFEPAGGNSTYSTFGSYLGTNSLGPYGAFYYAYSGSQTNKDYNNTGSTFYTECNTAIGSATTVFNRRRFASTETTTITIGSSTAPTATISVSGSNTTAVSAIKVNGATITSGTYTGSSNANTTASRLAGIITAAGYSTSVSNNVITITGPPAAASFPLAITVGTPSDTFTATAFTNPSVSSITVNGVELMSGTSVNGGTNTSTTASNIASRITQNSYSATASGNVITITGPTSAANFTPVITNSAGITLSADDVFPDTDAAKLTNFANWYSYYRSRMLMMKTASGRAFSGLNNTYRVGLSRINSSGTPATQLGTFESTQRTNWYSALYNTTYSTSGTPLRVALSNAGRYFAGQLTGVTDPLQYSCQQNFTILSTDGYWNGGAGFQLDGSTLVGNQDGTAGRPMNDGGQADTTVTTTYTRNYYKLISTSCTSPKKRLMVLPQTQSCDVTTIAGVAGAENCGAWSPVNSTTPTIYVAPFTSNAATCSSSASLPTTNPSTRVVSGTPVTTPGSVGGTSDTLADVAMYYYQTDLRTSTLGNCTGVPVPPATTGVDVCENNVFQGPTDRNLQQHMTTFTLGLGASGRMTYSSSYLNDTSGDYVAVKLGSTASSSATPPVCPWQTNGTVCNWPTPSSDAVENIDDLWHAAVNGRGAYFSATDPTTLSAGLSSALAGISAKLGSAAAAATSTLNPVAGNNQAFVASYTTVEWRGNLEARGINVDTGVVSENATWCVENIAAQACPLPGTIVVDTSGDTTLYNCVTPNAVICTGERDGTDCKVPVATACTGTMNARVAAASDTRNIKTANSAGNALINFDHTYADNNPTNFDATRIGTLSQWTSLTGPQQTAAVGRNLLDYLRGQNGHEFDRTANPAVDQLYRNRDAVLGDALESQPAFIGAPVFDYPYPGYSGYLTNQAGRAGTVFMGANDGMMHAFAAETGQERWAYVPSMVIPNMWKLADKKYSTTHTNFVNGSAITSDICTANCTDDATAVWKTILVGGLNGGGRGYYALDITVPDTPVLLWEFTPANDRDLGYSFGQAVITRKADGTWVVLVTSGYDNGNDSAKLATTTTFVPNSPTGNGTGYLYVLDATTGRPLPTFGKISTGVGTATIPSGLAKIAAWNDEPVGNRASFVYGGDLLGNVWRFDINTGAAMLLATLFADSAGTSPQPVTTTPVLGNILGKRIVFIGTGKYLESGDVNTTQKETQYAIKDDNATTTLVNPRNTLVQQFLIANPNGSATRLSSGRASTTAAAATNPVDFSSGRGWYVDFPDNGERVNIDSKLVQGTLLVPTIVPSNTVCAPGGFGWLNFFDYKTGGSVTPLPGVPLASEKYDSTIVGVNVLYVQGNPIVEVVTSTNPTPKKDPDVEFRAAAAGFTGKRVIWRELIP